MIADLTVALHDLGDRVGLYAYNSQGRGAVNVLPVKRFNDHLDALVMRRLNSLEQVMGSNDGLSTLNQQARAKVSEADMYEVIAALSKEEAAMSASQLSFSKISKLTLFDYIR